MAGGPLGLTISMATGPSVYFASMSGLAMSFMSAQCGSTYWPGAGLALRIAARTSSSLDKAW